MSASQSLIAERNDQTAILASDLTRFRPRRVQRYATVNALLLTWKDSDLDVTEDADFLDRVFREEFRYRVWRYQIPSRDSQTQLAMRVLQFIASFGDTDENLILVYYSGHGGPAKTKECIWSANVTGEPTLDWSIIQPLFLGASCDVVMFLDCCFAGQAVRSRLAHNVEFLAATDKDQFTPTGKVLSRPSFSRILCNQLVRMLEEDGAVTIPGLQSRMVRAELGLVRQPFYIALSEDYSAGKIRLTRWDDMTRVTDTTGVAMPVISTGCASSLFLRLSLYAPIDASERSRLSKWMTLDSPSTIKDIEIMDKAITKAELAEDIVHAIIMPHEGASTKSIFQPLSEETRKEGLRLFNELEDAMQMPETNNLANIDTRGIVRNINRKSSRLATFVTDSFASLESDHLTTLTAGVFCDNEDLASRISMRLSLLQDHDVQEPSKIQFADQSSSEQLLRIGKQADMNVLVEYHPYESVSEQDFDKISRQVARTCVLLREPKSAAFRTLIGKGYLHETLHGRRFGLIYELPSKIEAQGVIRLSQLITRVKIMPLELRYRIASCICDAVLQIHSIGWFHKSLKTHNIVFLRNGNDSAGTDVFYDTYDIENPYIIGFDCSRPSEAETWTAIDFNAENNIYRHPDRWGRPVRFERHHDIFALGTVLIEIGLWKSITSLDSKKKGFTWINPQKLVDFYLDTVCPRLAHAAGTTFADAARTCLQRENWAKYETWQFQRLIRNQVWQPLHDGM